VTLSQWFSHKTAAFSLRGDSNRSLKNYGFLSNAIFSSRVCMHTNHLATKRNYYARLLKLKM